MKSGKRGWILLSAGVYLLLFCILSGRSLNAEARDSGGENGLGTVSVSVKPQLNREDKNSFSLQDIKNLEEELKTEDVTFSAQSGLLETSAIAGNTSCKVRLTGTNWMYPAFNRTDLVQGGFFTLESEKEGNLTAVIDEDTAWNLFRSDAVLGKTIKILDASFRIIGVVKKEHSLIQSLVDDGVPQVFLPAGKLLELDKTARILSIRVRSRDTGTLDSNRDWVSDGLQKIGKDPQNYQITDFNLKAAEMKQKPSLILFAAGCITIFILAAYIAGVIRKVSSSVRVQCRTDYLLPVIKRNSVQIGMSALKLILVLTGISLIILGIRFRLYIPPKWIPEELIDVSYYKDLFISGVQSSMENLGYIPNYPELLMDKIQMLLGGIYILLAAFGYLMTYMGFSKLRNERTDLPGKVTGCGLIMLLSLILSEAVLKMAGLTYGFELKDVFIIWVFLFVNILIYPKGKDDVIHV